MKTLSRQEHIEYENIERGRNHLSRRAITVKIFNSQSSERHGEEKWKSASSLISHREENSPNEEAVELRTPLSIGTPLRVHWQLAPK